MPSVLEQKFRHKLLLNQQYRRDIENYCRQEIGGRTYYVRQYSGGKKWRLENQSQSSGNRFLVELDDDAHATILALKYGN